MNDLTDPRLAIRLPDNTIIMPARRVIARPLGRDTLAFHSDIPLHQFTYLVARFAKLCAVLKNPTLGEGIKDLNQIPILLVAKELDWKPVSFSRIVRHMTVMKALEVINLVPYGIRQGIAIEALNLLLEQCHALPAPLRVMNPETFNC